MPRRSPFAPSSRCVGLALALATLPAVASAQAPQPQSLAEAAAINMRLGLTLCLREIRDATALPGRLQAAGFTLSAGMDAGSVVFSAPGVDGIADAAQADGYCKIESTLVPLALATAIGTAVGQELYPGAATPGSPASPAGGPIGPCDGYSFWDARPIITVSYSAAGNSGECIDDGSSAIVVD